MQKQYAGNGLRDSSEVSSADGGSDGQGQAPADHALASVEIATEPRDDGAVANLALTGGAFVFEAEWTSAAVDLGTLDSGFSVSDFTGSAMEEVTSLEGSASDAQIGSAEIPIWGLSSDDFSSI